MAQRYYKAVFTQAISAGDFARRHDLDKNDPAEIAAVEDRKNPIENVTPSEKPCSFQDNFVSVCLFWFI